MRWTTCSIAPRDVVETVELLLSGGSAVRYEGGGRGESFGNVLLELDRPPFVLRIVRDRSQWSLEVAGEDAQYQALHVPMTAKDGVEPLLEERNFADPIPEQVTNIPKEVIARLLGRGRIAQWFAPTPA